MHILEINTRERIIIDGNIFVSIGAIEGNAVRVGVHAPKEVNIVREELLLNDRRRAERTEE